MHYIRFLKTPKFVESSPQQYRIHAKVTITTDLGDAYFDGDTTVCASVSEHAEAGHHRIAEEVYTWTSNLRALDIRFPSATCTRWYKAKRELYVNIAIDCPRGTGDAISSLINSPDSARLVAASAWSSTFKGQGEAAKRSKRVFSFSEELFPSGQLTIWEDTGSSIARHVWDAGVMLMAFLFHCSTENVKELPTLQSIIARNGSVPLQVLELGCGCGVVGLAIAMFLPGCEVLLTDFDDAQEIAEMNIQANHQPNNQRQKVPRFETLEWGTELPTCLEKKVFDLIVLADCIYNPDSAPALVDTLQKLIKRSPNALILMATKVRHPSEAVFFDLMTKAGLNRAGHTAVPLPDGRDPEKLAAAEHVHIYIFEAQHRLVEGYPTNQRSSDPIAEPSSHESK